MRLVTITPLNFQIDQLYPLFVNGCNLPLIFKLIIMIRYFKIFKKKSIKLLSHHTSFTTPRHLLTLHLHLHLHLPLPFPSNSSLKESLYIPTLNLLRFFLRKPLSLLLVSRNFPTFSPLNFSPLALSFQPDSQKQT